MFSWGWTTFFLIFNLKPFVVMDHRIGCNQAAVCQCRHPLVCKGADMRLLFGLHGIAIALHFCIFVAGSYHIWIKAWS